MIRQVPLIAFISFVLLGSLVLLGQSSDQRPDPAILQAAEAAFPASLRFGSPQTSDEGSRIRPYHSCATVFSKMPDGKPNLLAAGYGGDGAAIAMLSYKPGSAQIIDSVTNKQFWLTDGDCQMNIVNLAAPGQPNSPLANTIKASFDGPDWFFIWDGKKLQSITALEAEASHARHQRPPNSAMYLTRVVDIDHSGPMQIVGKSGDADKFPRDDGISSSGTLILFRFNGSAYAPAETLLDFEEYGPNFPKTHDEEVGYKSDVAPWTEQINMHMTPAPSYQLKIVNGDRDGNNRVSSAKVEVNGLTIVSPAELGQGVETLTRTIQLRKKNKIKVMVDGPDRSHIFLTVE